MFISNTELTLVSNDISVFIEDKTAHIEIVQIWSNESNQLAQGQFVFPLSHQTDVQYFIDQAGAPYQVLTGKDRLKSLWNIAKTYQRQSVLGFGTSQSPYIFVSEPNALTPGETIQIKFSTLINAQSDGLSRELVIPIDQTKLAQFTRVSVQGKDTDIKHFWHNLPAQAWQETYEGFFSFVSEQTDLQMQEDLKLLWTPQSDLTTTQGQYNVKIQTLPPTASFENTTIIIDRSGSMSDNAWFLVEDIMRTLFDFFPSEETLQVRFLGENALQIPTEAYSKNDRPFQQRVIEAIQRTAPLGKADFSTGFANIPEDSLVILITDETALQIPEQNLHLALFHFSPTQAVQNAVRLGGHYSEGLWRHTSTFTQADSITDLLRNFRETVTASAEFVPSKIDHFGGKKNVLFVQRSDTPQSETSIGTSFWSQYWAKQKIAELLSLPDVNNEVIDAILSIGRRFGVNSPLFQADTARNKLRATLLKSAPANLKNEILSLQNNTWFKTNSSTRLVGQIPFYKAENTWRQFDWWDRAKAERVIHVAPTSAAQEALFLSFPDIFAPLFALEDNVEACLSWRCIEVNNTGETEAKSSHQAFISNFNPNHWANEFVFELVKRDIINPLPNGSIPIDDPISRAEFARLVVEYFEIETKTADEFFLPFSDVDQDHPAREAIEILRQRNVLSGFEGNVFKPDQSLTRAEALKILLSSQQVDGTKEPPPVETFADTPGWEKPWAEYGFSKQIITGEERDGSRFFRPHDPLTLGEAAKIITLFSKE